MSLNDHKMTEPVSVELIAQAHKTIENLAQINKVTLDYSHESIRNIEKILALMHKDYKRTKNDEGLRGIALSCAAYIVETIQKNTDAGTWYRNDSEFGNDTYPFEWKDGKILYPLSWCEKRLFDGKADDVWYKYETLILGKMDDKKQIVFD